MKLEALFFMVIALVICVGGFVYSLYLSSRKK
jgi:hypothetical protein